MRWLPALLAASLLSGCASMGYYWQAVSGHLALMQAARPLDDWLADAQTPDRVKERLALAARIRRFAVQELGLPDNRSYLRYADLQRPAAVWNVVAAPELSLRPHRWCFPVAGCVSYKGFFSEALAQQEAQALRAQGLDAVVQPVPAYSTLGWLNWAGGDPLLNTFLGYPEGELARLIFHELAHQVVYVAGDTAFNESFATAVERLGGQRWLAQASDEARRQYAAYDGRRQAFRQLALGLRRELAQIYGEPLVPQTLDADAAAAPAAPARSAAEQARLRQAKQAAFERFRQRHAELRAGWGGHALYDAWVARSNNAALAALADYEDLAPAFEALFHRSGSWPAFYRAVQDLARLPAGERHAALLRLGADTATATLPASATTGAAQ